MLTPPLSLPLISSSLIITAAIAPLSCLCISFPLTLTILTASSSLITPATHAATYSPRLCPIIAPAFTPRLSNSFTPAYSTANSAACVTSVSSNIFSASASPSPLHKAIPLCLLLSPPHSSGCTCL